MEIKIAGLDRKWRCPRCEKWNSPRGNRKGNSQCGKCGFKVYVETSWQELTYSIPKIDKIKALEN